jgi:hypothetical protein
MTNTIEALDQFTQALGTMLPPPSSLGPRLPGEPGPARAQASRGPAPTRSGDTVPTGPATREAGAGLDPLSALRAAVRSGHWLGAAAPRPPLSPAQPPAVDTRRRGTLPADAAPHPYPAAVTAAGAEKSQPAAMGIKGITRQAPRGDWPRRARVAVLALTIGLGGPRVVRATKQAAAIYWRQQMGNSLTSRRAPRRGHATPHRAAPRRPE